MEELEDRHCATGSLSFLLEFKHRSHSSELVTVLRTVEDRTGGDNRRKWIDLATKHTFIHYHDTVSLSNVYTVYFFLTGICVHFQELKTSKFQQVSDFHA